MDADTFLAAHARQLQHCPRMHLTALRLPCGEREECAGHPPHAQKTVLVTCDPAPDRPCLLAVRHAAHQLRQQPGMGRAARHP